MTGQREVNSGVSISFRSNMFVSFLALLAAIILFLKKGWKKKNGVLDILVGCKPDTGISSNDTNTSEDNGLLVLCEDYVSAVRIACLGHDALPMFGTQLSDATLQGIIGKYDRFLVALDNDNRMVRASARQLVTRINLFGKECKNARLCKDPKRYGDSELRRLLFDGT